MPRRIVVEKPKDAWEFLWPKYPHMGPMESWIWDRFLTTTKLKFKKLEYDVRVGPGYVPNWVKDPKIAEMAKALTQLRIDVVGETEDAIWIFEVKPRAGRSALGQLISYAYWYEREYKPKKPLKLAVVCKEVDHNLIPIFESRGIYVFVV